MRSRLIKPGFFKNEKLAGISSDARLLFIGLWMLADREGRLKCNPAVIAGELFPFEAKKPAEKRVSVEKCLQELADLRFALPYQVQKEAYLQVANFDKHQKIHPREAQSVIPKIVQETSESPERVSLRLAEGEKGCAKGEQCLPDSTSDSTSDSDSDSISASTSDSTSRHSEENVDNYQKSGGEEGIKNPPEKEKEEKLTMIQRLVHFNRKQPEKTG